MKDTVGCKTRPYGGLEKQGINYPLELLGPGKTLSAMATVIILVKTLLDLLYTLKHISAHGSPGRDVIDTGSSFIFILDRRGMALPSASDVA